MLKKTLYLIDGTALCYRSFFAIKLSTSDGFSCGAVYGFYKTLKRLIDKYDPSHIGVCFDVSRKTHRREKYKDYKAHRPPMPDGLKEQFPIIKDLIRGMGMQVIEKKGYEADDVIASLCKDARKSDLAVVIASPDKDLCQLIEEAQVSIYDYNKDKMFERSDFVKKYGFEPTAMIDYLSIAGDSSDNIPGAKGIGKVGATKLIKEFGSLDNIFKNIDKLPAKTKEILTNCKDMVYLSKELVTLSYPDLGLGWEDLEKDEIDTKKVCDIFSRLEFRALLNTIAPDFLNLDLEVRKGIPAVELKRISKEPIALYIDVNTAYILDNSKPVVYRIAVDDLKDVLKDERVKKISYGFKNQLASLKGIEMKGLWFDVKVAAYLLDSSLGDYSLTSLVSVYLAENYSDIAPFAYPYFTKQLYRLLSVKLKEQDLEKLFFDIEVPLITVLSRMQREGVKVDSEILRKLLKDVDKRIGKASENIFKITECEFNLNSPKQLSEILFSKLKIKPIKKTKTGFSTNEEVLVKLSDKYPIAESILEYRQFNKLKNTYIKPVIEEVEKNKGMLHTQFNQTVTQTGRLSSSSPNLQSIPAKGEFSKRLREAFYSSFEDGFIVSGDYSQIELRILAHLSKDENLIEAFRKGLDIHSHTASLLFDKKVSQVSNSERNKAKTVNFGIIYGMSAYGLSKELKIIPLEAQNFIEDYFKRYPDVKRYLDQIFVDARKTSYVKTILGRRRILKDINSPNMQLMEFARRQAINAPIQGSCADLIKLAMVNINDELEKRKLKTKIIIQIHDELIFDVPSFELEQIKKIARKYMEEAIKLIVPVKVNLKVGKNWGQMQESKNN